MRPFFHGALHICVAWLKCNSIQPQITERIAIDAN